MFIRLKKNKKKFISVLLVIFLLFLITLKNKDNSSKKFESSKYLNELTIDKDDYNLFLLGYKNFNEKLNLKNSISKGILPRVAHAGGGFNNQIYTNSIEALESNKNYYLFFEIDFFLTGDNYLVCEHDFGDHLKTLKKFNEFAKKKKSYTPCTYKTLKNWLLKNPDKIIITDFKNRNIEGLIFISKNFKNFKDQFIPQIFHPKEYNKVKNLGYKNIIWTLYRYDKSNDSVLLFSNKMKLFAITMNPARARSGLAKLLKKKNIKTYVHTINNVKDYYRYIKLYKVDQIYTDWIK